MGAPYVTSFCWCMGLEMGTRVIAVLHLLVSLTLVVACSVFAANFSALAGTAEDAPEQIYSAWYKIAVSVAVLSVVHVLLAATLLRGAIKRSAAPVRAWVCVMCVLAVCSLLYIVVSFALHGLSSSGSETFLDFFEGVVFFGFLAYCILSVNSYYMMLRSTEEMDRPNKVDY